MLRVGKEVYISSSLYVSSSDLYSLYPKYIYRKGSLFTVRIYSSDIIFFTLRLFNLKTSVCSEIIEQSFAYHINLFQVNFSHLTKQAKQGKRLKVMSK